MKSANDYLNAYYSRGIAIRRSNVLLSGMEHRVTGEGHNGAPYGGFINISDWARTGHIIMSFAILTVIIACLGLFALSSYMVEQRGKEVSIRLVMGATLKNVYRLLYERGPLIATLTKNSFSSKKS